VRAQHQSAAAGVVLLLAVATAQAQTGDSVAVSHDSAQAIRDSLTRPPANPPFDAVDAVALPVRVITLPLMALGTGVAELAGIVSDLQLPSARFLETLAQVGISPFIGAIGPRSGLAAGLRFDAFDPVYAQTAFSVRGSQLHRVGVAFQSDGDRLQGGYRFQRNAQVQFWGIGPGSDEESETDFLWDISEFAADASLRLDVLTITGGAAFEDNRVGRGFDDAEPDLQDVVTEDTLFGLRQRTNYVRIDLGAALDLTYLAQGLQRRGLLLRGSSSLYRGADGTGSDFHRVAGTAAGYLPLNVRQSLVLQLLVEANRGDDGRGVPFTHLASLGDDRGARAYPSGRFRDRDMAALMSEWRYEIWRELHGRGRAEGFIFLDTGGVKRDLSDLDAEDLRESYGFGLRGIWGGQLLALAYLAFGDEGARLQAAFSWAY